MSRGTPDPISVFSISRTGLSPSLACFPKTVLLYVVLPYMVQNPMINHGLGSFHFARRYFGNRFFFLFLRVLRCFSSPGSPCMAMDLPYSSLTAGFPHSEIDGSRDICSSPSLFAAYHVFHRLLVPRHPPCALFSLIFFACMKLPSHATVVS